MAFETNVLFTDYVEEALRAESPMINYVNKEIVGGNIVENGSVKIKSYDGSISIFDYTGADMALETANGTTKTLLIDKAKGFNFYVDKMSELQESNDIKEHALNVAMDMTEVIEGDLWAKRLAGTQSDLTLTVTLTVDNIVSVIEAERVKLRDAKVRGKLLLFIDNHQASLLNQAALLGDTKYYDGSYGPKDVKTFGSDITVIVSSNTVLADPAKNEMLLCSSDFINYVGKLVDFKTYEPEKRFGVGVKGLQVYGVGTFTTVKGTNIITTK